MHKMLLLSLFLALPVSGGIVTYLVYEINTDFTEINKYEISLESRAPDLNLIKELASKTINPFDHPVLFDTVFPGQYYINYQFPGDGGWVDFISNTNQPKKIITLYLDAMCGGCITNATILGNKLETVFSSQKADTTLKINNILINQIFDTLSSTDMMMIDTLLFEQSVKENSGKIKAMDVIKINHLQDTTNRRTFIVLLLLDYDLSVPVQKSNLYRNIVHTNIDVGQRYFNINGQLIGKKIAVSKVSKGVYIGTTKSSNAKEGTILIK